MASGDTGFFAKKQHIAPMPKNSYQDKDLQHWQAQEEFSVVDFLAEAPDYFAREPFTIHVNPRSNGIHEFLNLQIQLKVARLGRLKQEIQHQIQANRSEANALATSPSAQSDGQHPSPESQQSSDISEGKLVYRKGNKIFEIAVSPEQLNRYFGKASGSEKPKEEKISKKRAFGRDIFDRFLNEPGFFKRSEDPESVPPDASIEASIQEDETVVTETLAKIHQAQGNYAKAMSIYEKLGLLFPEKSSYFEAQIEKLQDLDTKNDA